MEVFGCCSSYVECSDERRCLHAGDKEYAGCAYRKNLEVGRVFYGRNADSAVPEEENGTEIYLACFQNLFAVFLRHRSGLFSRELTPEHVRKVRTAFERLNIPYKTKQDPFDTNIGDVTMADDSPCNSRVVFALDSEEYHVLNFNVRLIKQYYADRISKAFCNKGIESRVELVGPYAVFRKTAASTVVKREVRETPMKYVQCTIFELVG